ncbi:MAG: PhzF family phenazine biosynthesis protein [Erysipelotrichales bacterium]|nr:PhzF family phenazine biosynthesis protein [Erysipelotrichales bacterium]
MAHVYVASAFSKNNTGGNKAGVVLDSTDLTVSQKKHIAKILGYSETAFISPSLLGDYKLEYFTPTDEVDLCGHATIATFSVLYHLQKLTKENYLIETKAGLLRIQVDTEGMILMEQNIPTYGDILSPILLTPSMQHTTSSSPIQIVSTGLKDILYPVSSIEQLHALEPDYEAMIELSKDLDVVGVHAFTITDTDQVTAICRNFAPLYGINEESATGTANCTLACYLFKHYKPQQEYIFEQGYNLHSPSTIIARIDYTEDTIHAVYVGGKGYMVCERDIEV